MEFETLKFNVALQPNIGFESPPRVLTCYRPHSVEIPFDMDLVVHESLTQRASNGEPLSGWFVSEYTTGVGLYLGHGFETKEIAIEKAIERLNQSTEPEITDALAKYPVINP